MTRKSWLVLALAACASVAAVVFVQRTPSEPAGRRVIDTTTAATPATTATTVAPAAPGASAAKPAVGYDRYRAELQRIRAAREKAQALQPNERCINRERFRKVGTTWERAGNC